MAENVRHCDIDGISLMSRFGGIFFNGMGLCVSVKYGGSTATAMVKEMVGGYQ